MNNSLKYLSVFEELKQRDIFKRCGYMASAGVGMEIANIRPSLRENDLILVSAIGAGPMWANALLKKL